MDSARILVVFSLANFLGLAFGEENLEEWTIGFFEQHCPHGKDEEKLGQLLRIERFYTEQLAGFVQRLAETPQADGSSLLEHTQVLIGSGMSNGSSHSCRDLPTLLLGGGLKHGSHHDFPKNGKSQTPLCDLFVTMLQAAGVETDRFGTSEGNLNELLLG